MHFDKKYCFFLLNPTSLAVLHSEIPITLISEKAKKSEIVDRKMYYDAAKSGERIRRLRVNSGLTQEKAAAALNVDRSCYSCIESGSRSCSVDLLVQMSELFGVSLDYLVLGRYPERQAENVVKRQLKSDIAALMSHLEEFDSAL